MVIEIVGHCEMLGPITQNCLCLNRFAATRRFFLTREASKSAQSKPRITEEAPTIINAIPLTIKISKGKVSVRIDERECEYVDSKLIK